MKKGKKAPGAPAHFQLFSTMMILLLAFFIVLSSLIEKENDSGFKNSIGDIQNAFGVLGGIGMLGNHFAAAPVEKSTGPPDPSPSEQVGLPSRSTRGDGGVGTNEVAPERGTPTYLQVVVPHAFRPGSAALSPEMAEYLDVAGTVLASYPSYHCALRQVTTESGDWQADSRLAFRRAAAVRHSLARSTALPAARMMALGYADWSVLPQLATEENCARQQILVFDLYKPDAR